MYQGAEGPFNDWFRYFAGHDSGHESDREAR